MVKLFDVDSDSSFKVMLKQFGRDIHINEATESTKVIITNSKLNNNYDDKLLSSLTPVQRGSTVLYNDNTYMVISEVTDMRYGHYKANMRLLPHTIITNKDCNMQTVPCYIEQGNPTLKRGSVMTLLEDKLYVHIPSYKLKRSDTLGAEFMIHGNKFKIISIDDYSQKGISILSCDRESINPAKDDIENNIAGGLACKVTPPDPEPEPEPEVKTISLATDATIEDDHVYIRYGQTKTFTAKVMQGETVLSDSVKFEFYADDKTSASDNKLYTATVNSNVCSIKANSNSKMGYFQIKVSSVEDAEVVTWMRVRIKGFI